MPAGVVAPSIVLCRSERSAADLRRDELAWE